MYEEFKHYLPIVNSLVLLFLVYNMYNTKEYFSRTNQETDILLLDSSGNLKTFKLNNIYDSIEQAKTEMRTEMEARVEKRGKYWANWAISQLRPLINTKISESTANTRFLYKGHTYSLEGQNTTHKSCLTSEGEDLIIGNHDSARWMKKGYRDDKCVTIKLH